MLRKNKFLVFVGIIVIQLAMVAAMPIRASLIRSQGREISLQLAPVDPYGILTGYSLDLTYDIARLDHYPWQWVTPKQGSEVFAILEKRGLVYVPLRVQSHFPASLPPEEVVLKGVYEHRGWRAQLWFGVEKLYIPEADREELSAEIRTLEDRARAMTGTGEIPPESIRADIKVDKDGNASLLRLHVGSKTYE